MLRHHGRRGCDVRPRGHGRAEGVRAGRDRAHARGEHRLGRSLRRAATGRHLHRAGRPPLRRRGLALRRGRGRERDDAAAVHRIARRRHRRGGTADGGEADPPPAGLRGRLPDRDDRYPRRHATARRGSRRPARGRARHGACAPLARVSEAPAGISPALAYPPGVRKLALGLVAAAALLLPSLARAGVPVAEIRDGHGALLAHADEGHYASAQDYGYLLTIGASARDQTGLTLRDVSVLGGRVRIGSMFVPAFGTRGARIDGLQVAGRSAHATPNTVLQVGDGSYAVFLQEAALPGKLGTDVGIVGVRVVAGNRQILLGLARKPAVEQVSSGRSPWLLFGLAPLATVGGPSFVSTPLLPQTGGIGTRAVAIAEQYLGIRYVWGGASPLSGFDCSGLVMYVYAQLGIHLTHFSGAQWNEG